MEATLRRFGLARLLDAVDRDGVSQGIQMAVSVVVALFFALVLRLEYPGWAVFTVLMLSMARFVGAVQEKAALRLIGTIVGGALGYLATSSLQQAPLLYLPLTFVVVSFSVAMFGQSRAPYAFFLVGMTYVVVASNSLNDPSTASRYAVLRVEEVGLGVVVSMVVQVLIFPRFANDGFAGLIRSALAELAEAVTLGIRHFSEEKTGLVATLRDFPAKSTQMRVLLRFGAMESKAFRQNIGRHAQKVELISKAAALVRSFARHEPVPEQIRRRLESDVEELGQLLREGFLALEDEKPLPAEWNTRVTEIWARLDAFVLEFRVDPEIQKLAPFESGVMSAHLLLLRELSDLIKEFDALNNDLSKTYPLSERLALAPAWPSVPWIQRGIRAGTAVVAGLIIENWLNPPGGGMMMLSIYSFTALNAISPDESGDRPAFRQLIFFTLVMVVGSLAMLASTPLLAIYAVQNTVMVAWAFLFGYWFHRAGGITVPLTYSFMMLACVVSLNAQKPVSFEAIVGMFFGLVNGPIIAALAQRLMWPALPQNNLRLGVKKYLDAMVAALHDGMWSLPLWRRTELTLFPAKARLAIAAMRGPTCPPDEARRLEEFILTIQEMCWEFSLCLGRLHPILPSGFLEKGSAAIERVKGAFRRGLVEISDSFAAARRPADLTEDLDKALRDWDEWMEWLRQQIRLEQTSPETSIPMMGISARIRSTLQLLGRANTEARALSLGNYLGDVSL
ncbi:MAG: FUSC family protein [Terrimicrobiaceae bacterium]